MSDPNQTTPDPAADSAASDVVASPTSASGEGFGFGMIFFTLFLVWGLFQTFQVVLIRHDSVDLILLQAYDLAWLGKAAGVLLLMLNVVCLYAVLRHRRWGVRLLYLFFVVNLLFTLGVSLIGYTDLDLLAAAVRQSRESRGMSLDHLDSMVTSNAVLISMGGYTLFYLLLAGFIHLRRRFFYR